MWRTLAGVFGTNVLAKATSLGVFMLLLRALSKEQYGHYTLAYSVYGLVSGFVFIALNFGMVRVAARLQKATGLRPWAAFASYGALQLAAYLGVVALSLVLGGPLSGWIFGQGDHQGELLIGLLAASAIVLSNYVLYVTQADEAFATYNRLNAARHLLLLPFIGGVWALGWLDWRTTMAVFFAANVIPAALYLAHPANRRLVTLADRDRALMREALASTGWLMLYFSTTTGVDHLGPQLLARASSAAQVAEFGAALRYYHVELLTLFSLNAVLLPRFAKADESVAAFRHFLRRWWLTLAPGYVLIAAALYVAEPAWVVVNTEAYRSAYPYFSWMTFGAWTYLLFLPALNMLIARRRFVTMAVCATSVLVAYVALGIWLAPTYGARGLAVLSSVAVPLIPLLMTLVVWNLSDRDLPSPEVASSAASSAASEATSPDLIL